MDLSHLGNRIRDLRGERGMTLQDLAAASAVSVSMLSAVERGQKAATVTVLDRIASGLGVSLPARIAATADSEVIVLPAGCDARWYPGYAPGSHEFVAVDRGTLRLRLDGDEIDLNEGDSAYFAADARHGYANPGTGPCTYHVAAIIMRPRRSRGIAQLA